MLIVITGGIGSGKSSVVNALKQHENFKNYGFGSIDEFVSTIYEQFKKIDSGEILEPYMSAYTAVKSAFGTIDKKKISNIAFSDKSGDLLKTLEDIFNPLISSLIESSTQEDFIIEYPLWFERSGWLSLKPGHVISVIAPEDIRISRAIGRGDDVAIVRNVVRKQVTDEFRTKHSDFVVENGGSTTIADIVEKIDMYIHSKRAVISGSFDPITNGHIWMIEKALQIVDFVIIAVSVNASKKHLFDSATRTLLVEKALDECLSPKQRAKVNVVNLPANTSIVEQAKKLNAQFIIRGIRNATDFEYENRLALVNRLLEENIETIYLIPPRELIEVSSSLVKSLIGLDNWDKIVSRYVTKNVLIALTECK